MDKLCTRDALQHADYGTCAEAGRERTEPWIRAEITSVYSLTETEKLYRLKLLGEDARERFSFKPGQFLMLEVPGIGQAPFSIASSPSINGHLELCIRKAGALTSFLARVSRGLQVGVSGPFGTSFPVKAMQGADILFIAGGLGIVPLRSALLAVLENRNHYGSVDFLYGAKTPASLLFAGDHDSWRRSDATLRFIVDHPGDNWSGPVGIITELLENLLTPARPLEVNTFAIVCGPPVMFTAICDRLTAAGLPMHHMFVSLERRMHCGQGKCCRCSIGSTYTCLDGPVFDYWSVMNLKEAI
ncbi:FAD/NAD(P)-binding protein [Desulfopila sp. IMCC35008]|uniref:FAD/NAD(P)-binding protein n=1 Tax=Desulfopila sp. IMCC35008 TaxID=2653858 RepID=UPI0013D5A507|nr:FAD/NAD(P)-binding protein [Desulfopila sp. IMCC35008]